MKTFTSIKFGISIVRQIIQGITTYIWNTYKIFQLLKLVSVLNKWPEEIKFPMPIASIEKE